MSHARILALLLFVLLFVSTFATCYAFGGEETLSKLSPLLRNYVSGKIDARLHVSQDSVYVFVAIKHGYSMAGVDDLLSNDYPIGTPTAPLFVYGKVSSNSLLALASTPGVSYVFPDVRLGFDRMKPDPDVYRQGLASDMYRVRQIIGADRVSQLGVNGQGVTIAIVDTGTDFAVPDLQQAVARNSAGQATSFDADGQSFVITSLVVHRKGDLLKTAGLKVDVWNAASYVQTDSGIPPVETDTIQHNYVAPSVLSKSGNYHFGILREEVQDIVSGETISIDFPIVVVDSTTPNVYDTVFVDMSTAYYNFLSTWGSRLNSEATQSLGVDLHWPVENSTWNDHSFADEIPHKVGDHDLIYFAPNRDGVPAFSAGLLAFGVDLSGRAGLGDYALLPPIDPKGQFINVFFDFESHGTSTASDAASRGILARDLYKNGTLIAMPGVAVGAKVMGVKALWLGDVTLGWYYAAGFDWNPTDFSFTYTGRHRADIISNSWGDSNPISDLGSTFGPDYMSELADTFSLPHYLDPAYPGVVMVMAGGNGGFGYGTTTAPAASTLAITVGASTSYAYRAHPAYSINHEVAGSYDEVVPWSARGPTSIGEPKPDVVDVGAFGFTDQSLITGYGNGTKAYDIFGGTSMATPVTSGAIALLIQEYRDTHDGQTPRPDVVKSILQSTAEDLNYDAFTQGSGRVDAYQAVMAAAEGRDPRFQPRFYVEANSTWDSVRPLIADSWSLNLQRPLPDESMSSANWFAGIVAPGSSVSSTFAIHNAVNPSAQPFDLQLTKTQSFQNSTSGNVSWITLPKSEIPTGTDLMKITLVYHFSDFVNASTWDDKDFLVAQLYDLGSNGSLRRINNGAPEGTTSELTVSRPLEKFAGVPTVRVLLEMGRGSVPFELVVRYYHRASWSWISNLVVSRNELTATLTIPSSAVPGVYAGEIVVKDGNAESLIPVSVVVPIVAPGNYSQTTVDTPYSNYAVYGAFDWSWRYEAGDWRTFAVILPEGVHQLSFSVKWSDNNTDIQAHLTSPIGYLVASSEYPTSLYVGSGKFDWGTTTGGPEEDISAKDLAPGVYLFVLHNTLFGADSFASYPETYTITVGFL